jgi:hypothetical protein
VEREMPGFVCFVRFVAYMRGAMRDPLSFA